MQLGHRAAVEMTAGSSKNWSRGSWFETISGSE